ncbi:uncharacterized protein LDX57_009159 [Aspergillus melleus]|uniref:uncharacterized protein n=1 Tax=Aspergillus melleus TaxID=138277 RepID=UPI001E8EE422|nr:uncharacterized protein LDX57_009159 [Aspergillus melleus]KAH8431496.1 hypothetical protein LDX57_009159 [Aspergillus melleus]
MSPDNPEFEPIREILTALLRYLDKGTPEYLDNVLTFDAVLIPPFPLPVSRDFLPSNKSCRNGSWKMSGGMKPPFAPLR